MKRLLLGLAILGLGLIIGASATNVVIGKQIDRIYFKNMELTKQLAATEEELLQWRNNQNTLQRVITGIDTLIDFPANSGLSEYEKESISIAVDEKVKEWLQVMLGQPIETVNYILVPNIINLRELDVGGTTVKLKVDLVVIAEHVLVHLNVTAMGQPHKTVVGGAS